MMQIQSKITRKQKGDFEKEAGRIIEVLIQRYNPQRIIIFGSFVSGDLNKWSDLDIVVVKETRKSFPYRIGELISLTEPKVPTDFLVYTPEEFEEMSKYNYFIKDEVLKKGKIVYIQNTVVRN